MGHPPATAAQSKTAPKAPVIMTAPASTALNGAAIVSDALKYQGAGYVFGGVPGPGRGKAGPWDCSSFCAAVIGRDLGAAIPGFAPGSYDGQVHGPVVLQWASWTGATTLAKGQPPSPGDLCIWAGVGAAGHMGIAISASEMISALDTAEGTRVTPIIGYGPVGATLSYRRINGTGPGTGAAGASSSTIGEYFIVPLLAGLGVSAALVGIVLGGAVVVGIVGAAILGAVIAKAAR